MSHGVSCSSFSFLPPPRRPTPPPFGLSSSFEQPFHGLKRSVPSYVGPRIRGDELC